MYRCIEKFDDFYEQTNATPLFCHFKIENDYLYVIHSKNVELHTNKKLAKTV